MLSDQCDAIITRVKTCLVYQNGNHHRYQPIAIKLRPGLKISAIQEVLSRDWRVPFYDLRLFNQEGVELFDEDLSFLKDGSKLYASAGEDFDSNTTYSEYETIRLLGEGGFGKVLLARHKTTRQQVAIKIVNTQMIGNAQKDIDMVFREAELLKSLDHRNIVKIISCYTLSNMQVVFIMEYLEGGELLEYLYDRGQLPEEEARIFFVQVAEAMQYCHQRKLIHRDLKLENILLANKEQRLLQVKIVDFGIAGLAMNMNVEKLNVGSLRYMAPETLNGASKQIGPALDVWAMGVILYSLVTGHFPFKGPTSLDTIRAITQVQYSFPFSPALSTDIRDLISRIFISDPSKRIKLKEVLDHDWVRQLRNQDPFMNNQMDRYILTNTPSKKRVSINLMVPGNPRQSPVNSHRQSPANTHPDDDNKHLFAEILQIPTYIPARKPMTNLKLRSPQPTIKQFQVSATPLIRHHMKTESESILPPIGDFTTKPPKPFLSRRASKVTASLSQLPLAPIYTPRHSPMPTRRF